MPTLDFGTGSTLTLDRIVSIGITGAGLHLLHVVVAKYAAAFEALLDFGVSIFLDLFVDGSSETLETGSRFGDKDGGSASLEFC